MTDFLIVFVFYKGNSRDQCTWGHENAQSDDLCHVCHEPDTEGIIIDGNPVLIDLGDLAAPGSLLLGMTHTLNLEYLPKHDKTFEVFQRLFAGIDRLRPKLSPRFISLKNKLLVWAVSMPFGSIHLWMAVLFRCLITLKIKYFKNEQRFRFQVQKSWAVDCPCV